MKTEKLQLRTSIGRIEAPEWEVKKLIDLTDEELLEKAIAENKSICVSPTTYAMIEKRHLGLVLQQMINPNIGMRKDTNSMTQKLVTYVDKSNRKIV